MRSAPFALALVAVVSALVTVGAVEVLRGTRPGPRAGGGGAAEVHAEVHAEEAGSRESALLGAGSRDGALADSRTTELFNEIEARLAELERRLAALERERGAARAPVARGPRGGDDELRELVLGWVAAEEAAGDAEDARAAEARRLAEMEFDARYRALEMARAHGLERWQQDELAALFLETARRADEIERGIDVATSSPEEVEAAWVAFDAWVDERERALTLRLDPALYDEIYGEPNGDD